MSERPFYLHSEQQAVQQNELNLLQAPDSISENTTELLWRAYSGPTIRTAVGTHFPILIPLRPTEARVKPLLRNRVVGRALCPQLLLLPFSYRSETDSSCLLASSPTEREILHFSFSQVFRHSKQTLIHSLLSLLPNFFRSRLNSISPSFTLYKSRSSPLSRAAFAPSHLDLGSQNFDYPFYAKKDIETFPLEKGRLSQPMGGPLPLLSFVEWCLFPLRGGRVISCL